MIDVLIAIADLVKGDATVDEALSMPYDFEPGVLYVWEEARDHRSIGTGEVREEFEIVAVYVTGNEGEAAIAQRSRDVTAKLDAWATAALDAVRENAHVPPWASGNIRASTDADFLRQLGVRGVALRVSGYRLVD